MSGSELYESWLQKYSSGRNPIEALAAVREEVELLMRDGPPPLEVRVAALEGQAVMVAEFILSFVYENPSPELDPEHVVERSLMALEFLRLAALAEAIELDKLANRRRRREMRREMSDTIIVVEGDVTKVERSTEGYGETERIVGIDITVKSRWPSRGRELRTIDDHPPAQVGSTSLRSVTGSRSWSETCQCLTTKTSGAAENGGP